MEVGGGAGKGVSSGINVYIKSVAAVDVLICIPKPAEGTAWL